MVKLEAVNIFTVSLKSALGLEKTKPALQDVLREMHEQGYVCTAMTAINIPKKGIRIVVTVTDLSVILQDSLTELLGVVEEPDKSEGKGENLGDPEVITDPT